MTPAILPKYDSRSQHSYAATIINTARHLLANMSVRVHCTVLSVSEPRSSTGIPIFLATPPLRRMTHRRMPACGGGKSRHVCRRHRSAAGFTTEASAALNVPIYLPAAAANMLLRKTLRQFLDRDRRKGGLQASEGISAGVMCSMNSVIGRISPVGQSREKDGLGTFLSCHDPRESSSMIRRASHMKQNDVEERRSLHGGK